MEHRDSCRRAEKKKKKQSGSLPVENSSASCEPQISSGILKVRKFVDCSALHSSSSDLFSATIND